MRRLGAARLAVLATALVGACRPVAAPLSSQPVREPAAGIQAGLRWDSVVSGAGVALVLYEADGAPLLRLACAREPAVMTVLAERFRTVGSEERLSLGFDDDPFVFVADTMSGRPQGVEASAPISDDLLRRLEAAREVAVSYGSQRLGPHIPPDPETARGFAAACRRIAGRG